MIERETLEDRSRIGRPSTSAKVMAQVENAFHVNPNLSLRTAARDLGMLQTIIHKHFRKNLAMVSSNLKIMKALQPQDYYARLRFAQYILREVRSMQTIHNEPFQIYLLFIFRSHTLGGNFIFKLRSSTNFIM